MEKIKQHSGEKPNICIISTDQDLDLDYLYHLSTVAKGGKVNLAAHEKIILAERCKMLQIRREFKPIKGGFKTEK